MVMRTGDIYEYSLDSSGIMDHTTLRTSKSDVVNSFASFMQHRSGELTLIESVDYEPEELFSDQRWLEPGRYWILCWSLACWD